MAQPNVSEISIARPALDAKQMGLVGLVLAAAVAFGAYSMGPVLKKRLSQMPVVGQVAVPDAGDSAIADPQQLPVALGVPPEGAAGSSSESLEGLEEIFLPSTGNAPAVDPMAEALSKAEVAIRNGLSQISVDALSSTGVFMSGRFYRFGEPLGISFPDGKGGTAHAVLAGADGSRAKIRVGDVTHWIGSTGR